MTDDRGVLIEFSGLPGTGKSTLAGMLADELRAVVVRIDEIEAAMRRNGLAPEQTGIAAYSVAHAVAYSHLLRGLTVIADAVSPVDAARAGWRGLAADCGAAHVVIEVRCPDLAEHRRRAEERASDIPGLTYPDWAEVRRRADEYEPRTDARLVIDSTRPVAECYAQIREYVASAPANRARRAVAGAQDPRTSRSA